MMPGYAYYTGSIFFFKKPDTVIQVGSFFIGNIFVIKSAVGFPVSIYFKTNILFINITDNPLYVKALSGFYITVRMERLG